MTMYWIYDVPNWALAALIILTFATLSVAGFYASRPLVARLLGSSPQHNDVVSYVFAGVGVFYGLALGLIAVATWEDYTGVGATIGREAAALSALYHDLDGYPPAPRARFEQLLRDYTKGVVEVDWPAHRKGEEAGEPARVLDQFEDEILAFEPSRDREKAAHAEALSSLDEVVEQRNLRVQSVTAGLPAALWSVVLSGALLNVVVLYLFWVENRALHAALVALFATFIALLVFLTAAMDNPFRGEFSVTPGAFQELLDTVMKPPGSR